ncbi:MAG: hypothetical protein PHV07_09280 [Oscillospiraceae bacterium]|nr:hypothetical protein [Oscillospiraceae bacterium]
MNNNLYNEVIVINRKEKISLVGLGYSAQCLTPTYQLIVSANQKSPAGDGVA